MQTWRCALCETWGWQFLVWNKTAPSIMTGWQDDNLGSKWGLCRQVKLACLFPATEQLTVKINCRTEFFRVTNLMFWLTDLQDYVQLCWYNYHVLQLKKIQVSMTLITYSCINKTYTYSCTNIFHTYSVNHAPVPCTHSTSILDHLLIFPRIHNHQLTE